MKLHLRATGCHLPYGITSSTKLDQLPTDRPTRPNTTSTRPPSGTHNFFTTLTRQPPRSLSIILSPYTIPTWSLLD